MKSRLLIAASTLALLGSMVFVSAAHADDGLEADVGGGAAGIVGDVSLYSYPLSLLPRNDNRTDGVELVVSTPRVEMGKRGGSKSAQVLNKTALGLSVRVVSETIKGNRQGNPYAQASSSLVGIRGVSGKLAGFSLGAINVSCLWNRAGASGETVVTDVAGNVNKPAANEVHDLPGLGSITFNEQYTDLVPYLDAAGNYVPDTDGQPYYYLYSETLYVIGAHIHLDVPLDVAEGGTVADVYLGFTSCDPLQLPPLSGVKLLQASSD